MPRLSRYWNLHAQQPARIKRIQAAVERARQDADDWRLARGMVLCAGCGKWSDTHYCNACAKEARCPHGYPLGDCQACDIAADFAFDAWREAGL